MIREKLFKTKLGLKPQKKDDRDLSLGFFMPFGKYKPKHKRKVIETLSVKIQSYNTCGWSASATGKEIDEKVKLSTRGLVILGKLKGFISGDGFSTLRNNEKVLQKDGIPEEKYLSEKSENWKDYSHPVHLTSIIKENALTHKTKSYWAVKIIDEIYKAIDDGRVVKIGIRWYSGFNMRSGFKMPWIIFKALKWLIGGHAMLIKGYDLDYKGQKVAIVQNQFGKSYGNNGDLYIAEDYLQGEINRYGAFCNLDMPVEIGKWLVSHQGYIVKTKDNPDVYLIQGEKKRKFTDLATFYNWGYLDSDIITIQDEYLDKIEEGSKLLFWDGKNTKAIKAMIMQKNKLKNIFQDYFNELF